MLLRLFCLGDIHHPLHRHMQSSVLCERLSVNMAHASDDSDLGRWLCWIQQQSYRRLAVAYIYLLDFQVTFLEADHIILHMSLLDHVLPDGELLWSAATYALWANSMPCPGQAALQTLTRLSQDAEACAKFWQLHPFTAQTISYFDKMATYHKGNVSSNVFSAIGSPVLPSYPSEPLPDLFAAPHHRDLLVHSKMACLLSDILGSLPAAVLRSCISRFLETQHIAIAKFLSWLASSPSQEVIRVLKNATALWQLGHLGSESSLFMPFLAPSIFYSYVVIVCGNGKRAYSDLVLKHRSVACVHACHVAWRSDGRLVRRQRSYK
jgi:hypothetical protein